MWSKQVEDNRDIYFLIITYINLKIMMLSYVSAIKIYTKTKHYFSLSKNKGMKLWSLLKTTKNLFVSNRTFLFSWQMAQVHSANADDEVALVGSIVIKQKDLITLTNLCNVKGNVRNRQKHESNNLNQINKIMSITK